MQRLFNILYTDHSTLQPEVIISLDAKKAFNRVEWNYLFTVLEKFGFGPIFCTWIKIFYSSPTASVHTNNITSNYFPLQRGTRQDCCLSPFLFDLAIEPLAIALRSDERILGVTRREMTHKVSLYADDLLLYISNPENSIPHLIEVLREFGKFSGYKLSFLKTLLFPINKAAEEIGFDQFPFKVELKCFMYLGKRVTSTFVALYSQNFAPLLDRTKTDLAQWSNLPISLAGCTNSVKMTVLPKF